MLLRQFTEATQVLSSSQKVQIGIHIQTFKFHDCTKLGGNIETVLDLVHSDEMKVMFVDRLGLLPVVPVLSL